MDNFPKEDFNFVLGNYDYIFLNKLIPQNIKSKSWRTKTRLLFNLSEDNNFYLNLNSQKTINKNEVFWDDFSFIKDINEKIGYLDYKRVLTNIHILSLEHHINLFYRHKQENSICENLLKEWESILAIFISHTKKYLQKIWDKKIVEKDKLNEETFSEDFYKKYYQTINNLRSAFEKGLRLINRSARHWVIGSKSHIEFTGTDNIFHFGNTAKIYNAYTIILEEIQKIFAKTSCEEEEKINFFLVPDNNMRTSSAILFPSLTPNFERLISINLSTEIIFNFQMLGLMMHEIGQFICHQREDRNKKYLSLIIQDFTTNIASYFFSEKPQDLIYFMEEEEKHSTPQFYLGQYIYKNIYQDFNQQIKNLLERKIEKLIKSQKLENGYSLYKSPMDTFAKYLKAIFPTGMDINHISNISKIDNVLEDSKYHHQPIDLPDYYWDEFICNTKTNQKSEDLISIISDLPKIIQKWENRSKMGVEFFYKNRDKLKNYKFLDINDEAKLYDNKEEWEELEECDNCDFLIKNFFDFRKKIIEFLDINDEIKFEKFENKIIAFLQKNQKKENFSDFKITETNIIDYRETNQNNKLFNDFTELLNEYLKIDVAYKTIIYYRILEYYLFVYIYEYEDLFIEINKMTYHLHKNLNHTKIFSGIKKDKEKLVNELKKLIQSKRPFKENQLAYLDQSLSHAIDQNKALIKETKADYFMIRLLKMTEDDYIKHYQVNTDADMEFDKFDYQKEIRLKILTKAKAFSEDQKIATETEPSNEEKYQVIANMIQKSVNPVLDEFRDSKIIQACQKVFKSKVSNISNDLEFISTILSVSNSFKKE